jgi:hypothetical protein
MGHNHSSGRRISNYIPVKASRSEVRSPQPSHKCARLFKCGIEIVDEDGKACNMVHVVSDDDVPHGAALLCCERERDAAGIKRRSRRLGSKSTAARGWRNPRRQKCLVEVEFSLLVSSGEMTSRSRSKYKPEIG